MSGKINTNYFPAKNNYYNHNSSVSYNSKVSAKSLSSGMLVSNRMTSQLSQAYRVTLSSVSSTSSQKSSAQIKTHTSTNSSSGLLGIVSNIKKDISEAARKVQNNVNNFVSSASKSISTTIKNAEQKVFSAVPASVSPERSGASCTTPRINQGTSSTPISSTKMDGALKTQNISAAIKRLEPSKGLFEFVKSFEGYSSIAYRDKDGVWTIGIGHVLRGKELEKYVDLKTNKPKKSITEEKAYEFFKNDIKAATDAINKFMENNNIQLSQNQFDALVSFTFNVGSAWTDNKKSKTRDDIIKAVKNGIDTKLERELRDDFLSWSKAKGQVLEGLQRRRYDEWEMFVKGDYKVTDINTWRKIKKEIGL